MIGKSMPSASSSVEPDFTFAFRIASLLCGEYGTCGRDAR
jgi:hypothetical protein